MDSISVIGRASAVASESELNRCREHAMSETTATPRLEVRNLVKRFGGAIAVDGIDLCAGPGEIIGVVGPNGSGKSTLMNLIMGVEKATAGSIHINGTLSSQLDTYQISRLGVHYSFQRTRLLPEMSAAEHLQMAIADRGVARSVVSSQWAASEGRQRVEEVLGLVNLAHLATQRASELSFGQRQLLCLAMAVIRRAQLILLDEPLAGLSGESIGIFARNIQEYAARGAAVLIVEHRLRSLGEMCQRFVVMDHGQIIADGTPTEVMKMPLVLDVYFGKAAI